MLFGFGGGTGRWVVWSLSDRNRWRVSVLILVFPCFMGQNFLTPHQRSLTPGGQADLTPPVWWAAA
jgi:hypothetical protein